MASKRKIRAADLFCGAGGTSTGLILACEELGLDADLLAINHWEVAIATHSKNHPEVNHLCASLDSVDPRRAVQSGRLDLLVASPECIHHSIARGGKPINDQSRASAWMVLRWCEAIRIENVLIENVKEFQSWGPLGVNGRPLKRRKGETYLAFLKALESLGYTVDARVLNAADYGDPTSRERLFIVARKGRKPIRWPEPTHAPDADSSLFGAREKWRAAREIIDWSIPGESIFNRKRPLSPNTMARIFAGLKKYSGLPFIVPNFGEREGQQPRTHSISKPLPAVTGHGAGALVSPFIVNLKGGERRLRSVDKPLPTQTAGGGYIYLCELFVLGQQSGSVARDVDKPLPTIATDGAMAHIEPFLVSAGGPKQAPRSVDEPVNTFLTRDNLGVVQPFLVTVNHGSDGNEGRRARSVDEPVPTLTTVRSLGVAEPFLVKYNGTGGAMSVDEPLDTVTAKDRFGLCIPELGAVLDIRFRMLQPHELARAMSFPDDYKFEGNREQKVRQIGNAVPVNLAKALCKSLLEN